MSVGHQTPERVAHETLRGQIRVGEVVDSRLDTRDCRPVELLKVRLTEDTCQWIDREDVIARNPDIRLRTD